MKKAALPILLLLAPACADPAPQTERPPRAGAPNSDETVEAVAPQQQSPAQDPPFFAVNQVARPLLPASNRLGRLEIREGCLVFAAGGVAFTPIWPMGSRLLADGTDWVVIHHGNRLSIGSELQLPGGPYSLADQENIRIADTPPANCPEEIFAVG